MDTPALTSTPQTTPSELSAESELHQAELCQNCDTPLKGEFCHTCGQNKESNIKFFGDIVMDLLGTFFSYDSKVNRTLVPLLLFPGRLAKDYIAGHRIKYISPFRLYLFVSLIFFIVLSNFANIQLGNNVDEPDQSSENQYYQPQNYFDPNSSDPNSSDQNSSDQNSSDKNSSDQFSSNQSHPGEEPETANKEITLPELNLNQTSAESKSSNILDDDNNNNVDFSFLSDSQNDLLSAKMKALRALPEDQQMGLLLDSAALTIFIVLPIFAMLLKMFYLFSNRLYVEHMVVALYSQSFVFVIWIGWLLMDAFKTYSLTQGWELTHTMVDYGITALWWWFTIYLFFNLKVIYQQGWWMTSFKFFTIGVSYFVLAIFTIVIAAVWTLVSTSA